MDLGRTISAHALTVARSAEAGRPFWPHLARYGARRTRIADVEVQETAAYDLRGFVDRSGGFDRLPPDHCLMIDAYRPRSFLRCTASDVVMTRTAKSIIAPGQGYIEEFNVGPPASWPTELMQIDLEAGAGPPRPRRDAGLEWAPGLSIPLCHFGLETFGHFMLDALLQVYLHQDDLATGRAKLVHWPLARPWMAETLERCGAPGAVRRELRAGAVVMQAARLSSALAAHGVYFPAAYSLDFVRWLKEKLIEGASPGARTYAGVYVRRDPGHGREVLGQERLEAYLQARGFFILDSAREPIERQAQVIAGAHTLVSSWGSGLALAPLLGGARHVIELTPAEITDPWFLRQAVVHRLRYTPVVHASNSGRLTPDLDAIGQVLDRDLAA